jgi:hypothetical protein
VSDPILERFAALGGGKHFQPARRHLADNGTKADTLAEILGKPKVMMLQGEPTDFYTIGALAAALGRKTVTVRSWEAKSILPLSRYRKPVPRGTQLPDKAPAGQRLYTRPQIEVVVAAAKATGVLEDPQNANWRQFTHLVVAGWRALS